MVDDVADIIYDSKDRQVWAVFRYNFLANLRCIPDYLNEFGERNGFETILKYIANDGLDQAPSLTHVSHLLDFLSKT